MRFVFLLAAVLSSASGQSYIGRVDTVGGTTYDWQATIGVVRMLVNSPNYGLHAACLSSGDTAGAAGLNIRYNFYDYGIRRWGAGVDVFAERTGFGNIDADQHNGSAVVCGYVGTTTLRPIVARDAAAGAGIFEYAYGPEGYLRPLVATDSQGTIHVALSEQTTTLGVWYSRIRTWDSWDSVVRPGDTVAPAYNIVASRRDGKVCVQWGREDSGSASWRVFYVMSTDAGETWNAAVEVPKPPAFGADTTTMFSGTGPLPFFDDQGRLHLVASVRPVVADTAYVVPAEIWHWCADNEPDWAEIHRAATQHLEAPLGHNAVYADRPSIGQATSGTLYASWEQFDSSNVEPQTNLLRAGVWAASSADNGESWTEGRLLTERNTLSHRYPCIVDRMLNGGMAGDTVAVLYLADQIAGSALYSQGPFTFNPVICQFVPASVIGVSEQDAAVGRPTAPNLLSTVMRRLPVGATAFDAMGRWVLEPRLGIYFVRDEGQGTKDAGRTRKVVVTK
jgi:hypothetical protein